MTTGHPFVGTLEVGSLSGESLLDDRLLTKSVGEARPRRKLETHHEH